MVIICGRLDLATLISLKENDSAPVKRASPDPTLRLPQQARWWVFLGDQRAVVPVVLAGKAA